jgi:hypothetical protein
VMQITVTHDDEDRAVATLAHEFQHTVEVLEHPEVRTEADVDRLFERIGYRVASGLMETQAALDIERTVANELRAARTAARR